VALVNQQRIQKSLSQMIFLLSTGTLLIFSVYYVGDSLKRYFVKENTLQNEKPTDFLQYLTGGTILKNGEIKNLYDYETQLNYQKTLRNSQDVDNILAFRTPPIVAALYAPLTTLSYEKAFLITVIINGILLAAITLLLLKTLNMKKRTWILLTAGIILYLPIFFNLQSAQISILILFFCTLSFYFLKKKQPFVAGIAAGMLFLKPHLLTISFLVFWLLKNGNRKKYFMGAFSSVLALILISTAMYGPKFVIEYPMYLIKSEDFAHGTPMNNQINVSSLIYTITEKPEIINAANVGINVAIYAGIIWLLEKRKSQNFNMGYAAVVILGTVANLHTMPCELVFMLIPIYATTQWFVDNKQHKNLRLFILVSLILPWGIPEKTLPININPYVALLHFLFGLWLLGKGLENTTCNEKKRSQVRAAVFRER
jgi:chromate transport protein ChrA